MAHNPLDQFRVHKLIDMQVGSYDLSFTNSALAILMAAVIIICFFSYAFRRNALVPSYSQAIGEKLYLMVAGIAKENIGEEGKKFVPLIFSLFCFILMCNLLGLVPYNYTATSHIAVTFTLAIIVFMLILVTGLGRFGFKFFSLFLPKGTPWWLAPLMIVIELFSFLSRPITLSMRLAANMIAGHVLLKVIAGFGIAMGALGVLPFGLLIVMNAFELFVAVLQAYIFTILTCVYINDAVHLH